MSHGEWDEEKQGSLMNASQYFADNGMFMKCMSSGIGKEIVNNMKEQYIKFTDENVDGCGTDVTAIAKVYGNEITIGTIGRIKDAICNYKNKNEKEWDTDVCLDVATGQLKAEGYEVYWIDEETEICF